jgi:polyvinyl alcohol dehydrogenase (cytochrome)
MQYFTAKVNRRSLISVIALVPTLGLACCGWTAIAGSVGSQSDVSAEFPSQFNPANLPQPGVARFFPHEWPTYSLNTARNAVYITPDDAPLVLKQGVSWKFAGAGAIALDGPPLNGSFVTTAYTIGMPVGVSAANGIIYVGDDNGYTYALNAISGKLIWAHYGWNMTMSNPLVVDDKVFVTTGNPYFNYANTMVYLHGKRPTRGTGLNSMYALDARSGKEIWVVHFDGEAMPTAAYDQGYLYLGTGDGHIYKIDAAGGHIVWKSDIISFVSMSSTLIAGHYLYVGGTHPNYFYAISKQDGHILWKLTLPKLVATGMGDCTPAYDEGIVVQEATVETDDKARPVANVVLGLNAQTGQVLWKKQLASGPTPPTMKTATPMIADGRVFEGSPVSGDYYSFDLKTGRTLWRTHLGAEIRAGAAVEKGIAYIPYKAGEIAALRVSDGKLLASKHFGGAFGPSSPVIVGGTLYVSNVYGWVLAIRLRDLASNGS